MKLNLAHPFADSLDAVEAPDPWGTGVVFLVRPADHPDVVELVSAGGLDMKSHRRSAMGKLSKRMALAQIDGTPITGEKTGELLHEVMRESLEALPDEAWADAFGGVESRLTPAAVAEKLLVGWKGLVDEDTNAEVGELLPGDLGERGFRYDRDAAVEVLSATNWIPAGRQYGGQAMGPALIAFLLTTSQGAMKAIAAVEEEVEGESAASSASGSSTETSQSTSETRPSDS